jgi:ABC-type Fe3+ transport system permease subunit
VRARPALGRLLLIPLALACLLAGLLPLAAAAIAAGYGMHQSVADPELGPALRQALGLAAAVAAVSLPLGLLGSASIKGAAPGARRLVLGLAVCLLVVPAPRLAGFPDLSALAHPIAGNPAIAALVRLACAVARGTALVVLITAPAVGGIPRGLRRAALCAGAGRFQAWRHVVLAPVWLPACIGLAIAMLAALAQTPAAGIIAPHLDLADAWVAPASLLLVACSATALIMLLRPRRTG